MTRHAKKQEIRPGQGGRHVPDLGRGPLGGRPRVSRPPGLGAELLSLGGAGGSARSGPITCKVTHVAFRTLPFLVTDG